MLVVIGCGNSNRSDDGVGVFVAQALLQHLQSKPRSDVRVFDAGTGGMEVMFLARRPAPCSRCLGRNCNASMRRP